MFNKLRQLINEPCVSASAVQMASELGADDWWSRGSPPQTVRPSYKLETTQTAYGKQWG